jgi:lipoprotein-releasing system permease protein
MIQPTSLFIGLRYTFTQRRNRSVSFISGVAMVGIVLGVGLLITVLSVMNGFDKELKERILNIMPQVTIYHRSGVSDWQSAREEILMVNGVQGVTPFVELQSMLHHGRNTQPALVYGVEGSLQGTVSTIAQFLAPTTISSLEENLKHIAIGSGLAEKLNVNLNQAITIIIPRADQTGDMPAIQRMNVVDIFSTGTELDHSLALISLESAAKLSVNPEVVSGLQVKVNDLFSAPSTAFDIRQKLLDGYYSTDWTRSHGNIYYAIQMSKNLVTLLLLLIIAIAAFNVVSTLVMVVVDKQKDIAILRTMGMSDGQIMSVFIIQGTVIGVIGTFIGVILGVILALTVDQLVAGLESLLNVTFLQSDIYPISFLPSHLNWGDVLLVACVSLLMSFISTFYPARKAMKLLPAEALRYD